MSVIPINIKQGSLEQEKACIIGIDLGTTNSLVAIVDEHQQAVVLKKNGSSNLTPSVVHITADQSVLVGDEAKQKNESAPERTIHSVKRLIGKSYNDITEHIHSYSYKIIDYNKDKMVRIVIDNHYYTPVELSAFILKDLKSTAESVLQKTVSKAVITVPAYYNDTQRQAVKDAARLAGLEVLRIINEPTAAGLAYGVQTRETESKIVAVYDLGGGTFDISILRITNAIFEVIATKGDTYLGGDDIDNLIAQHWKEQYHFSVPTTKLKSLAEKAKQALSAHDVFSESIYETLVTMDRVTLSLLSLPVIERTISICADALSDAKLTPKDIDEVILVGGMTRAHFVREAISRFFKKQVNTSVNPDEAVALGAAIQANILAGENKDILLLDVVPLSVGVETMGGLMDVLIARNTTIPAQSSRIYTTQKDGQVNMRISVFQGERDLVKDNRKLGEFHLKGIPPMPAGLAKIEIYFFIDANGMLVVRAKELQSGIEQEIEIKPQYGLSKSEIEKMIQQSIKHAEFDIKLRSQVETIIEGEQLINASQKFLAKNKDLLSPNEIKGIETAITQLEDSIKSKKDRNEVLKQIDTVNTITMPLAERIMNESLRQSLGHVPPHKGKT